MDPALMEEIEMAANAVLAEKFPTKIRSLREVLMTQFTLGSLGDANKAFLDQVKAVTSNPSASETQVNSQVTNLRQIVREELAELVESLMALEVWVSLSVPAVSDGNNFGVEVQEFICKEIVTKKEGIKTAMDGLGSYHSERAGLWEKAVFPVLEKKSASKGVKKSSGGEKNTNETTESEDVAISHNLVSMDSIAAIAWLDTQQYFKLKTLLSEALKVYAVILDGLTKNMEKVKDPRGEGDGRGGGISMF